MIIDTYNVIKEIFSMCSIRVNVVSQSDEYVSFARCDQRYSTDSIQIVLKENTICIDIYPSELSQEGVASFVCDDLEHACHTFETLHFYRDTVITPLFESMVKNY